jgi:UDP-glucose 4-epimerase
MAESLQHSCIVTGAAGFLGRYISRELTGAGYSVIGIDSVVQENAPISSLSQYFSMMLPSSTFSELLKSVQPVALVHCAGRAAVVESVRSPADDFSANVALTFAVLESLRLNAPNCRFLFLSSAAVYGDPSHLPVREDHPVLPLSPYGFHKHLSEEMCREFSTVYGMKSASLRIFSAYGAGLRRQVVWDICRKALCETQVSLFGTGEESRDFVHARDVAQAALCVLKNAPMHGERYNVGTGREESIATLAHTIMKTLNIAGSPVFTGEVQQGVPCRWQSDITRIRELGFSPRMNLEDGVRSVLQWAKAELTLD